VTKDLNRTLREYIDAQLTEMWASKLIELGYWCPRCEVDAFPFADGEPGWCPICGMDPTVEGPRKPFAILAGLFQNKSPA